jgi:hypothetical protein
MGENEIHMGNERIFDMHILEQQGRGEYWNLKTTIVGMGDSLLEL